MELEKQQEEEEEMGDDPFESCDEDSLNDEIQWLLCKRTKPIIITPASRQSIIDWVASAWSKIEQHPDMVAKSFLVTGIASDLETGVRMTLSGILRSRKRLEPNWTIPKMWTPTFPVVTYPLMMKPVMMKPVTMISVFCMY